MPTRNAHHCPRCGYNLSGLDPETICPECMLPGPAVRSVIPLAAAEPAHLRTLALAITLWGVAAVIDAVGSIAIEASLQLANVVGLSHMLAIDVWRWIYAGTGIVNIVAAVLLCSAIRHGRVGHHGVLCRFMLIATAVHVLPSIFTYVDMLFFQFKLALSMSSALRNALTLFYALALTFPFLMAICLAHVSHTANSPRRAKVLICAGGLELLCGLVSLLDLGWMLIVGQLPPDWLGLLDLLGAVEPFVVLSIGILSFQLARRIRRVVIPEAIRPRSVVPEPTS